MELSQRNTCQKAWMVSNSHIWECWILEEEPQTYTIGFTHGREQGISDWPDRTCYKAEFQTNAKKRGNGEVIFLSWKEAQDFIIENKKKEINSHMESILRLEKELKIASFETENNYPIPYWDLEKYL